jgi:hypothetical protein
MRYFPNTVLDKLDAGLMAIRGLARFDFGTGTYGFWTGASAEVINGLNYIPGGPIEFDAIPGSVGMDAQGMEISLAEAPADGLTPAVLSTIEAEDYHQRPVTLSDVYIDPETREVILIEPVYRGYVDTVEHVDGPEAKMVAKCESRALDNSRSGYRMRSSADQQLISAGDRGFEHAEVAGKVEIYWGRDKPK